MGVASSANFLAGAISTSSVGTCVVHPVGGHAGSNINDINEKRAGSWKAKLFLKS